MKNIFDSWKISSVGFIFVIFFTFLTVVILAKIPSINPIYSTFIISISGTTIISVGVYFFSKVIFNKKYSPRHAELFTSLEDSSYDYKKILKNTSIKKLFISDQNLHIITQDVDAKDYDYKSLIFNLLKNGTDIYLMLCDSNKEVIKTWGMVTGKSYEEHLANSKKILRAWRREYNNSNFKKGEFIIFTHPFVPLNIIAIDFMEPSDNSKIIIIPIFYNMPEYRHRPVFIIEYKKHEEAFKRYRMKISNIILPEGSYEGVKKLK